MPSRRVITALVGLALLGFGGVAGWALNVVLEEPEAIETGSPVTYVVEDGSVGRSIRLNVNASWPVVTSRSIGITGTVTSIDLPSGELAQVGDVLMTVDLRPVVIGAGETPVFRDMQRGDKGADIAELQLFLTQLGYYHGAQNGNFDRATEASVVRWHKALGVGTSGIVGLGELVLVPVLPAAVSLGSSVDVGSQVDSSTAIQVLANTPELRISLQPEQLELIQPGMSVTLQIGDTVTWKEVIDSTGTEGQVAFAVLSGVDGAPVCVDDCGLVPMTGETILSGAVEVVPDTTGSVVPSAAVLTDAIGTAYVVGADGARIDVKVLAANGGLSVVDGVKPGQSILANGDKDGESDGG